MSTQGNALRTALREALDWIEAYEDGHSYCNTQVGGGWAPEPVECTCGFDAKMDGWRAALPLPEPESADPITQAHWQADRLGTGWVEGEDGYVRAPLSNEGMR